MEEEYELLQKRLKRLRQICRLFQYIIPILYVIAILLR